MNKFRALLLISFFSLNVSWAQKKELSVIGYYAGPAERLDSFPINKLTHIIFSFGHLKGNQLSIGNARDSACIKKMVSFRKKYPGLKIILSLGGWGGCKECSPVFSTATGRDEFANSTKALLDYFDADGIDLDWEYPAIAGYPGHVFTPADRRNFTLLLSSLRNVLGKKKEISFAAGGFDLFIDSSIEWKKIVPLVDKINIMTYDLVHGNSTVSGHHTPLYSTPEQKQSTDNAVMRLLKAGVPAGKLVIGAAFYCRFFQTEADISKGIYQPTHFLHGFRYASLYDSISATKGFVQYWDPVAKAPYAFNNDRKILATYDDSISIRLKTKYAMDKKLDGIMFWQLAEDRTNDGLLDVIDRTKKGKN
ncbi:MAG TPA: glycoside hydrolase family 18 protein [Chitinophagaceae bacterium]|nr:glycoside hydrolase family 18 protein [Chitinophagaceae bacterium]